VNGIFALCVQDFKRLLTNALFWVLTVTLVIIILVVNFALPGEVSARGDFDGAVSLILPVSATIEVLGEVTEPIPFNKRITPVFVCFEALITGFLLGGALMLAEKEEETVRALRIAPMGAIKYLLSKTLLFAVIGTIYASLITVFCVGVFISWLIFIPLAFLGTAIMTLIGLAYTTLFRDMSSWFFSLVILLCVNMLPIISYMSPSYMPLWIKLLPSFPILFSFEKVMFGGSIDLTAVLYISAWVVIASAIAYLMMQKNFLKGAKNL